MYTLLPFQIFPIPYITNMLSLYLMVMRAEKALIKDKVGWINF